MYKKITAAFAATTLLWSTAFAAVYNGECMNQKGKMAECQVDVSDGTVSVQFKKKMYSKLNRTFSGDKITGIHMGEYARRRVAEAVVGSLIFLPLGLLALAKKKQDQVGVEFSNEQGQGEAVLISVKKRYGVELARNLRAVSGLPVAFGESPKKKISKKEQKRRAAINQELTEAEIQLVKATAVQQPDE